MEKEECINHVTKRMGSALRTLAIKGKKADVVLRGRGYDKLTKVTITKLTGYFGKAICMQPSR